MNDVIRRLAGQIADDAYATGDLVVLEGSRARRIGLLPGTRTKEDVEWVMSAALVAMGQVRLAW